MHKILIVGPAWVGDMVMAQTLMINLKQLHPQCRIDVLAPPLCAPLLERMPEVHTHHPLPLSHGELNLKTRWRIGRALRAQAYQHAYVLPNSFKSALIPFFAGIKRRTGWRGEWRYGLLNDCRTLDKKHYPLMIQRFIALAMPAHAPLPEHLAKPHLQCDTRIARQTYQQFNIQQDKPIVVLAPGAEYGPAKQWPAEHFATTATHFHQQGWQIWLLGANKDKPIANAIQHACGNICKDFTGRTDLGQAVDLINSARLVITNDSGLMHIACALQRPTVAVYGSSSPAFTPPLGEQVMIESLHLECSPCFARECPLGHTQCLHALAPQQVIASSHALLNQPCR